MSRNEEGFDDIMRTEPRRKETVVSETSNSGLLGTLIERLHALSDQYLAEAKRKPGGQQTREKSKREIYEQFAYELRDLESLALPTAPPQGQKPLTTAERDELDGLLAGVLLPTFSPREREIARTAARTAYRLAASLPAQAQEHWEHQHDYKACHFPGGGADCDNPNHWWISKAKLAALPPAQGWHAEKDVCGAERCACGHFACRHGGSLHRGVPTCEECDCNGFTERPAPPALVPTEPGK